MKEDHFVKLSNPCYRINHRFDELSEEQRIGLQLNRKLVERKKSLGFLEALLAVDQKSFDELWFQAEASSDDEARAEYEIHKTTQEQATEWLL